MPQNSLRQIVLYTIAKHLSRGKENKVVSLLRFDPRTAEAPVVVGYGDGGGWHWGMGMAGAGTNSGGV